MGASFRNHYSSKAFKGEKMALGPLHSKAPLPLCVEMSLTWTFPGEKNNTPTPWLTLLLVLVKSCVKQVQWNHLIKTEKNLS